MQLGSQAKVRLFLDLFNITNAYAAETISYLTGSTFQAADGDSGTADGCASASRFVF